MPINFNGTNIDKIIYNGTTLDKVIYNGVVVWESFFPVEVTAEAIPSGIRFGLSNRNKYSVKIEIALDFDYSDIRTVTVEADTQKVYDFTGITGGYNYEYEVFQYVNNESKWRDYGDLFVPAAFQKVVTSVYTKPNTIGFALNNKNSFGVNCIFFIDGSWKGLYIANPGETTSYDISIPEKAGRVVKYEVSYGKADGGETFSDKTTGSIYIETDETTTTTTTTTYALGEPTSTEGNFKYYQGGKNARPINK